MDNPPAAWPQLRLACTLPFSLHLAVTILGLVGVVLAIVAVAIYFHNAYVWALISGALAFASGLQGLLVNHTPASGCFKCHGILAGFNLFNLGIFGVASLFLINPFWVIWAITTFATELAVTIVIFGCTKQDGGAREGVAMEMPTAQPNGDHFVHGHPADGGFKQPYMP